jgi:integrase
MLGRLSVPPRCRLGLPEHIRKPLARWGLVDDRRTKSLAEHVDDWKQSILAGGSTDRHAELLAGRVGKAFDGCRFRKWSDVSASKLQTCLADLRKDRTVKSGDGKKVVRGFSSQTFNFYLQACKQFCRWMVKDRRAHENPLAHLSGLNVKTDRRHDRRALSADELAWLLDVTERGHRTVVDGVLVVAMAPVDRSGMSAADRAMLYRLAVETGLRAGELRSLTRSSFVLEGEEPSVTIAAAYAKNRRQDTLPLRPVLAEKLAKHLEHKMPQVQAFNVPPREHVAKMLRADLEAARQAWLRDAQTAQERTEREKTGFCTYRDDAGLVADFHALRHTFISNLAAGGVHPKTAQQLARHSTITLTMDRYSHTLRGNLAKALDVLPELPQHPRQSQAKTGTADAPGSNENHLARYLAHLAGKSGQERSQAAVNIEDAEKEENPRIPSEKRGFSNGGGGIRTPVTLTGQPVFKTGAFSRSATPPG